MANVGNIFGSLERKADKLGMVLGFTTGSSSGFNDVISSIENALAGNIHPPDLEAIKSIATEPFVKTGIKTAVVGLILKELNFMPITNRIGSFMQKVGSGYAIGSTVNKLVWSMTHSPGNIWGGLNAGPSAPQVYPYQY